jgi:hypothetical protein
MDHMVAVTNSGWSIAAWKTAPAIAGHQRPANAHRDGPHRPAHVEGFGIAAHDHRNQPAIAGQAASCCGADQLPVVQGGGTKPGNHRHPAYRCKVRDNTRHSAGHVARAAPPLDDYVERLIVARLQRPDATALFTAPADTDLDTTALHTEAAALGQRLTDLSAAFAEGVITVAQLRTGTEKLRARLTKLKTP